MKKIKVELGKTINIGNYESIRIDLSIEKDIKESKNFLDEQEILFDKLNLKLKKLEKKIKRKKK